ncbi:hypothetical protein [Pseudomonas sp. nanlin1]|uniref:hypothetical protein n=1 Tax=Pseudomonas sp. nanlin1 TaxID=3040605 RepID=UPI00388DB4C1
MVTPKNKILDSGKITTNAAEAKPTDFFEEGLLRQFSGQKNTFALDPDWGQQNSATGHG